MYSKEFNETQEILPILMKLNHGVNHNRNNYESCDWIFSYYFNYQRKTTTKFILLNKRTLIRIDIIMQSVLKSMLCCGLVHQYTFDTETSKPT